MQLTNLRLVGGWTTNFLKKYAKVKNWIISQGVTLLQIFETTTTQYYLHLYEQLMMHQYTWCGSTPHIFSYHVPHEAETKSLDFIDIDLQKMDDHCRRLRSSALGWPMTAKGAVTILFNKGSCKISDRNLFPVWGYPPYVMWSKQERNTHQCQEWFQHTCVITYIISYSIDVSRYADIMVAKSLASSFWPVWRPCQRVNHLLIGTAQKGPRCFCALLLLPFFQSFPKQRNDHLYHQHASTLHQSSPLLMTCFAITESTQRSKQLDVVVFKMKAATIAQLIMNWSITSCPLGTGCIPGKLDTHMDGLETLVRRFLANALTKNRMTNIEPSIVIMTQLTKFNLILRYFHSENISTYRWSTLIYLYTSFMFLDLVSETTYWRNIHNLQNMTKPSNSPKHTTPLAVQIF